MSLLTKVAVRRSLYLATVKPHLCYATEAWSPAQKSLKAKVEQVNNYPRTRRSQSAGCYLTFPAYNTSTLQASYFVRTVKLWNN